MKKFLLFFLFTLQFYSSYSQITLDRVDYPLEPDDTVFSRVLLPSSVAIPTEGSDIVWDYTNVAFEQQVGNIENAGTHPAFPTANIVEKVNLTLIATIGQETHFAEQLGETGHLILGREIFPSKSDLSFLTSSFSDSINLLGNICVYEEPLYIVKFPLNYQDTFSSKFSIHTPFEFTLPFLNFHQTPSEQVAHIDYQYEVSSWGTLILPNPLVGGGQKSFDALLLKREQTRVDSFYLDSMPANPLLLGFFQLEQGLVTKSTNYTFWVKGLNRSALSMSVSGQSGNVIAASMSRDVNKFISTSTNFIVNPIPLELFPNPTKRYFQVIFDKTDNQPWTLSLFNIMGKKIHTQKVHTQKGRIQQQVGLKSNLPAGSYYLLIENGEGQGVASKKVVALN